MSDYQDGDYIHDTQWLALKRAIDGNAILTGCALTPVTGMQTQLGVGTYIAGDTKVTISSPVNFTHSAADPTYDRWDLIYATSGGQFKAEGAPSIAPSPPDLPAGAILLQMVRIPAGVTVILVGYIYDFGFTSTLREHATRHHIGGTDLVTPAGIGAEPAFSKNTAFNKNFGTDTTNVVEIGATLVASRVVETDASAKIISVVKGTAYNKSFGTGTTNIPEIGATLGNSKNLETDTNGKLVTTTKGTAFNVSYETSNPAMNGTASPGTDVDISRGDHVHPTDTSRAPTDHAVDASTYGWGSTGVFGHLKVGSGLGVTSGVVSLAVHGYDYHTDRTRRIFFPASACNIGGAAVYAEITSPSNYIVHGIKFAAINDYLYTTIPWKENISSTSQIPKIYICYAQEGCGVGSYVQVNTSCTPIGPGYPALSAAYVKSVNSNLTTECDGYNHKQVLGWSGNSGNYVGYSAMMVKIKCLEAKTIWITGVILEYLADE